MIKMHIHGGTELYCIKCLGVFSEELYSPIELIKNGCPLCKNIGNDFLPTDNTFLAEKLNDKT